MPRAEPGTIKWLANKMKAKGLQKLKWYCQMCKKQCRDENGFKCHRMSEGHQRQMQIFCEDANRFMDDFSKKFEHDFMRIMKTTYCRTRVLANTVYSDMISDRHHVHMNSTIWVTLTEFVIYLGRTNKCKIDKTQKGWYLQYIDHEKIRKEEEEAMRRKSEVLAEDKVQNQIQRLIEEGQQNGKFIKPVFTDLNRENDEKIVLQIKSRSDSTIRNAESKISRNVLLEENRKRREILIKDEKQDQKKRMKNESSMTKVEPALDRVICEIEKKKKLSNCKEKCGQDINSLNKSECWIKENLIVKIIDEKIEGGKFYRRKGQILSANNSIAKLSLLDNDEIVFLKQSSLESVIPNIGGKVCVVKGKFKDKVGILRGIDIQNFLAQIEISDSDSRILLQDVEYDEICKICQ